MIDTRYQCTVCGYEYKQVGQTVKPDRLLTFEDLPATWRCPQCGVLKNLFKAIVSDCAVDGQVRELKA